MIETPRAKNHKNMLFNSYEFILIFLPATLLVFFTLSKFHSVKLATASLAAASIVFYAYWDIRYLPLLIGSVVFNYVSGSCIERLKYKTVRCYVFVIGIAVNLALLGYFKYTNFFIDSWNQLSQAQLVNTPVILPLGISFFTFTQIAYLVDAYRGETKGYSFLSYILFVTFFPHLIAGPILYHKNIIPQFSQLRNFIFSHENFARGITIFTIGLAKKILIADNLAGWVKPVFSMADTASFNQAWIGALSYTFQLYFDFSGYSDMAIGLGWMLNIHLPVNFNSPYKATSIIDFWRRWHITLSTFLKDYLYIPLGGSRKGHQFLNIMVTMLLGGLWHGAGWTFVIWGGLHGVYIVINHIWRKLRFDLPNFISWGITFSAVVFAWVFFRASSVHDALALINAMLGFNGFSFSGKKQLLVLAVLVSGVVLLPNSQQLVQRFQPKWWLAVLLALVAAICLSRLNQVSEFIYYQF